MFLQVKIQPNTQKSELSTKSLVNVSIKGH